MLSACHFHGACPDTVALAVARLLYCVVYSDCDGSSGHGGGTGFHLPSRFVVLPDTVVASFWRIADLHMNAIFPLLVILAVKLTVIEQKRLVVACHLLLL